MSKTDITAEQLRELIHYDPESGAIVWRVTANNNGARAGSPAGTISLGYLTVTIRGHKARAHRWAWFYTHGEWPKKNIDHIDGDKLNNRISNLREATQAENLQNLRAPRRHNKAGVLGVRRKHNKWSARITVDGRESHLGNFKTPEEASAAYIAAKRLLHPFGSL